MVFKPLAPSRCEVRLMPVAGARPVQRVSDVTEFVIWAASNGTCRSLVLHTSLRANRLSVQPIEQCEFGGAHPSPIR